MKQKVVLLIVCLLFVSGIGYGQNVISLYRPEMVNVQLHLSDIVNCFERAEVSRGNPIGIWVESSSQDIKVTFVTLLYEDNKANKVVDPEVYGGDFRITYVKGSASDVESEKVLFGSKYDELLAKFNILLSLNNFRYIRTLSGPPQGTESVWSNGMFYCYTRIEKDYVNVRFFNVNIDNPRLMNLYLALGKPRSVD